MIKRAESADADVLASLAIQMWTDHDPDDLKNEFRELLNDENAA